MNLLPHAEAALDKGFYIFPLAERSKIPTPGSRGLLDASADPKILDKWLDNRAFNVAVNCGDSDLAVIDIDQIEKTPRWLLESGTYCVETSRGFHFYFWGKRPTQNIYNDQGEHIGECKSVGGYVLCDGSIHPSGSVYTARNRNPVQPMPEEKFALLIKHTPAKTPAAINGPRIPYGQHDKELTRIAGKLRYDGMEENGIARTLEEVCEKRCEAHGSDYKEMCSKIAKSVCRYAISTDGNINVGGQPTPIESDEEPEETFDSQDHTSFPECPIFSGALTDLAQALCPSIPIAFKQMALVTRWGLLRSGIDSLRFERHLQPRFYVALIALPNRGKTAALNESRLAIETVLEMAKSQIAEKEQFGPTTRVFGNVCTLTSADSGPFLVEKFFKLIDTSKQGAASGGLLDITGKILLDPDELSDVFEKARSSNTRISTLFSEFLKLHSGNRTGNGTKGTGDMPVDRAHLAIVGGVTLDKYPTLWTGTGAGGDGLMSRFIPMTTNAPQAPSKPLPTDTAKVNRVCERLAKLALLPGQDIDFDAEADKILDDWWAKVDTKSKHATRVLEMVKQLLIVLAVTNAPEDHQGTTLIVGSDLMRQATRFGDYIISARELLNPVDSWSNVQAMENAVIEWMQKNASQRDPKTQTEARRGIRPERKPGGLGAFKLGWDNCASTGVLKRRAKSQRSAKFSL